MLYNILQGVAAVMTIVGFILDCAERFARRKKKD